MKSFKYTVKRLPASWKRISTINICTEILPLGTINKILWLFCLASIYLLLMFLSSLLFAAANCSYSPNVVDTIWPRPLSCRARKRRLLLLCATFGLHIITLACLVSYVAHPSLNARSHSVHSLPNKKVSLSDVWLLPSFCRRSARARIWIVFLRTVDFAYFTLNCTRDQLTWTRQYFRQSF